MQNFIYLFLSVLFLTTGCQTQTPPEQSSQTTGYPAEEGFNKEGSDSTAIAIADSVMAAMGGYQAWKDTPVISWNFFGNRIHTWDKHRNRDRIEIPEQNMIIDLQDITAREGTVIRDGENMTHPDSLSKYLQQGYRMWVNDSYWLLMPYKLKDSGVTLEYLGIEKTGEGVPCHTLKLTFENVGVTPENKYHVYVDTTDYLVRQWAYFPEVSMDEPQFVLPWKNYRRLGDILLSGDRGRFTLSDIEVMEKWPRGS